MFYKTTKDFFLKKTVNKRLLNSQLGLSQGKINSIGIVVDEKYFTNRIDLLQAIASNGFSKEQISVLVFKDSIKKNDAIPEPFYGYSDVTFFGAVKKQSVVDFVAQPFDLLISYYDIERPSLTYVTTFSNAKFKVGFESVNNQMNHLLIATETKNYKTFVSELFKYLNILNKI
jgi:hypothetical protein